MTATIEDTAQAKPCCTHQWFGEWLQVTTFIPLIRNGETVDLIHLGDRWFRFRDGIIESDTFVELTNAIPPEVAAAAQAGTPRPESAG